MIYIKFRLNKSKISHNKKSIIDSVLSFILPKANPDYENKINLVTEWFLEFDSENSTPNREIGLENSKPIMKMPSKKNYGYWTDNNLTLKDFENSFSTELITKQLFIEKWDTL